MKHVRSASTGYRAEVSTLRELFYALKYAPLDAYGDDGIDWADLPTFGGAEPASTLGIWSWDKERLLIGASRADLEIVARS